MTDPTQRNPSGGHSTKVRMELRVNGRSIPVAQAGGGQRMSDHPVTVP